MATLEKLVRTVEALKLHQTPSVSLDETMTKKDKISHCVSVTDVLCNQGTKNSPESAKYLAMAMDMYFTLLDDQDSDMRMVADENLNRVIRTLGENNVTRIQVELYKEIKKNGSSRCVRSALWRFSYLAPYIRPAKCRAYLVNLLPCLEALSKRTEESVHETLAFSLPLLFKILGNFTNDNEVKILMSSFLCNIGSASAVLRRTAATNLVVLAVCCRKPVVFASWLLNTASNMLLPLSSQIPSNTVIGVLTACRQILPHIKGSEDSGNLLKLYEICLFFLHHADHNMINASLETLQCLLRTESSLFLYLINTPGGLMQSSISVSQPDRTSSPVQDSDLLPHLPTDISLQSISDYVAESTVDPVLSISEGMPPPPVLDKPPIPKPVEVEETPPKLEPAAKEVEETIEDLDIGNFLGEGVSIQYLARLLVSQFLLSKEKNTLILDSLVRVSVKTLALTCMCEVITQNPQVWNLPVSLEETDLFTTVSISDLSRFLDHEDPGLRGTAARLLCIVLRGASVESGGQLSTWFDEGCAMDSSELTGLLLAALKDNSSLTIKQALSGIKILLPRLIESSCTDCTARLLEIIPTLATNSYWLIKVEVCDLLSKLDPLAASFILPEWSARTSSALMSLLADEDLRVRQAAAATLADISRNIFHDRNNLAYEKSKIIYQDMCLSGRDEPLLHQPQEIPKPKISDSSSAFQVILGVYDLLKTASSKHLMFGCIEALHKMVEKFPPTEHPGVWGIHMPRVTRPSVLKEATLQPPASSILNSLIVLVESSVPCMDLLVHATILRVAGALYSGLVCHNLRETGEVSREGVNTLVLGDPALARLGDQLLSHTVKLLAIAQHVLDDVQPVQSSSKPSLPSLQSANLSPIKKKPPETLTPSSPTPGDKPTKDEKKAKGYFFGNAFYMKMFDLLKSSYNVYRTSLDAKSEEKVCNYVSGVLVCFTDLMNFSIGHDVGKTVEEYLGYMKACMPLTPMAVLQAVQGLLNCLFKNNYPFLSNCTNPSFPRIQTCPSIFEVIISGPYTSFTMEHGLNLEARDLSTSSSSSARANFNRNNPFRSNRSTSDKTSLASYIRLFEPMVIKALKHYTVSCHMLTQVEVLKLLIQLVRLRVNYCLLDSDQIFTGFVLKQLENIEENQLEEAETLIPTVFEFLLLLSYENYHSKVIIDVPKILHLCEGLSAGDEKKGAHAVAALRVVATDLFTARLTDGEDHELETQREVIISMLLRHITRTGVIHTISNILVWIRSEPGGDDKARKLSRQILDLLLPQLCSHQMEMKEQSHVAALIKLLKCLCPGALRPCDALVSSLLSCAVDLNSLPEMVGWLGFTLASLIIIFQLSPEEAVLGRLQELGIMLGSGGSSILDSSLDSSFSSSSDPLKGAPGTPPEYTLVTFLLHSVGAAVSKLHQITFSPIQQQHEESGVGFFEWELKELLIMLTYIMQSGNCPRIAKAGVHLARNCAPGALHNVDLITDMVLQMAHRSPTIVTQWLELLVLLERSNIPLWAKVLNTGRGLTNSRLAATGEMAEPAAVLNLEIVRRSCLAVVSSHLIENNTDGELLAWFLSSQIREIVEHSGEPQINELVSVIHRQAPSSGLFLQSISARWDSMNTTRFMRCILDCLASTHKTHTGRLLQLLVNKFLAHPSLALAKRAGQEACTRVETLLQETENFVHAQLPQPDLAAILETLSKKKLVVRFSRLISLLNRLSVSFYELSPVDFGEGRKFHPGSISNVELDNGWFIQQVKRYCCSTSPPQECAKLLSNLGFGDIMLVLTAKDFKVRILEECLVQGITLPDGRAPSMDSLDRLPGLLSDPDRSPGLREVGYHLKEGPPLYRAASQVLLQHIKNLVELLPRPPQVYRPGRWWEPSSQEQRYGHKLDDFFARDDGRNLFVQLLPAFSKLLLTYPQLPGRRPTLPPHAVLEMARFGILALELVKWMYVARREDMSGHQHVLDYCLQVASLTFSNPHLTSALSLPAHNALVSSAVLSITDFVLMTCPGFQLPEYPFYKINDLLAMPSPASLLVSGACLSKLLMVFEQKTAVNLPDDVFTIVVGLSRLNQFASLTRAPPLAFSLGWDPDLKVDSTIHLDSIPEYLLQEKEVLHELVWRLNSLGWSSRAQFEETWMSLLSVLNVSHDDLSNEEISALSQSTAMVVNALSSLLVATLALPVAGVPGAQLLHHPRDTPDAFLLTGRGQQLTAIQNIIHQRLDDAAIRIGLPVDSSVNLERAHSVAGDHRTSYSPVPRTRYGAGQVSLSYIMTCMAYHEEGADDRQSITSSALPLFLLIREENLAAAGLDTNSCIHFIIDLFSQWLAFGGQDTPLTVLNAAVKSIIMVSDIFTQSNQFKWMLSTLSELQKVHPVEDEVMVSLLCLGLSKAVAILGNTDPELMDRLKKSLEAGLRSQYTFARTTALHGALYLLQIDLGSDLQPVLGLVVDHIKAHLLVGRIEMGADESTLIMWSTLFFVLENFQTEVADPDLENNLQQLAFATSSQADLPRPLYTCLLAGLERLVVAGQVRGRQLDQLVKIVTDLMTEWAPVSVIPAVQLFLAAMYASHPPAPADYGGSRPAPITDPELLMQMMEQMSILFDCVRRAGPPEAELLSEILPQVLIDFFPASDVVNRVISEFISPGQPHPPLLAGVLRQIFRAAVVQDQQSMLTEWVLVSLPNFTRRAPLSHSIWCLTCFFIAASNNPHLQDLFPHLLYRGRGPEAITSTSHEDRRLFCLAGADFFTMLTDKRQRDKFIQTFETAAEPGNPYSDLLATLEYKQ